MQTLKTTPIKYNKETINSHTESLYTDKIRSGQTFLYRESGSPSMVVEVRLKEAIRGTSLEQAFQKAILRYPYLTCKLVEKNGDFYLTENPHPFRLEETSELHSLGGLEVNFHLIDVTYKGNSIYISYHHSLCDGRGIMPFVRTLIYYYCKQKYKTKIHVQNIRLAGEPLLPQETAEPISKCIEVKETRLPQI
ncbi:MAG: hypothetical protein K0S61_2655 [Anaerocolumna sp.]|nr:hypothetical protein [Anaerocolumna sp.]